jgi:NAD+ diphosphatase
MSEPFLSENAETKHPADTVAPCNTLEQALRHPDARFLLFQGERVLLERDLPIQPAWISCPDLTKLGLEPLMSVDLGIDAGAPRMALEVLDADGSAAKTLSALGEFQSLRDIQAPIAARTWRTLARARALLSWNLNYGFCPSCGAVSLPEKGGAMRTCTNTDCGRPIFARTDPSVIVRITLGERLLLARQPRFRPGLWSVLAGFVEPGETLEEAVRREVGEEVGLAVDHIHYLGSQPWPFPMNLMAAFEARALDATLRLDAQELEEARWYTREQMRQGLDDGSLLLPSQKSISHWMIKDWLDEAGGVPRTTRERLADSA